MYVSAELCQLECLSRHISAALASRLRSSNLPCLHASNLPAMFSPRHLLALVLLIVLGAWGCSGSQPSDADAEAPADSAAIESGGMQLDPSVGALPGEAARPGPSQARFTLGEVEDDRLDEASGLVASRAHEGVFWTHNDSGGKPLVFAIGSDGRSLGAFDVDKATLEDWEDIELGPGPEDGVDYLYIGDIGDNRARRLFVHIYRVEEPVPDEDADAGDKPGDTRNADRLTLTYPDGPRDAETLLIDADARMLYIVAKRSETVGLYATALDFEDDDERVLRHVADLTFPRVPFLDEGGQGAVGGDLSPDGRTAIIKTYSAVLYYRAVGDRPWYEATPTSLYYVPEPQGEAIAFGQQNRYYTLSEERDGIPAVLYAYQLPSR